MRRKNWFSTGVCLLLLITISFSACQNSDNTAGTTAPETVTDQDGRLVSTAGTFRLSYSKSDSLNPFFAQSLNNQLLMPLMYEPLFTLDKGYVAQNCLASSFSYDGTALTVALAPGRNFRDGSSISAADVVYSFNKAKSSPAYKAALSSVKNAAVRGGNVLFTLDNVDLNAQNLLTFPIVKNRSAEKTDDTPIGSGQYKLKLSGSSVRLVYSQGKKPKLTSIDLVNAVSQDSIANSLKVGNVSMIFKDLSDGSFSRISSKTVETGLNNLVYLGINSNSTQLSAAGVRQALNYAVNRTAIVNTAYQGHARTALSPFNPDWTPAKDAKTGAATPNSGKIKKAMEQAGYIRDPKTRLWKKGSQTITLRLLVNKENAFRVTCANLLARQLKEQGFSATVSSVKYNDYVSTVKSGKFDLYVGELRLPDTMSLSALLEGGQASAGIGAAAKASRDAYRSYREGTATLDAFLTAFENDIPFLPLCYRNGLTAYNSELKGDVSPLPGNIFAGIEEWSF